MELGFIGLGNMGFPIARRLLENGHRVAAYDTRTQAVAALVEYGAHPAVSVRDVADRADTVLASLPSLQASQDVATGPGGVIGGSRVKRFADLSTVGSRVAQQTQRRLAERGIAQLDCPVSGGVGGAEKGALAVMVSGPRPDFDAALPALETFGRPIYLGDRPGSAQTMKLVNNLLSATALVATCEAVVMGTKSGLDPAAMIELVNAGSGANSASRDKFPRAVLPRSFDYGFATGLMLKDLRLWLEEAHGLGLSLQVAESVVRFWETATQQLGPDSDFTSVIKPIENAAGVVVGGPPRS